MKDLQKLFRNLTLQNRQTGVRWGFDNKGSADSDVTLFVYDIIDGFWGSSAKDLADGMKDVKGKTLHLRVNSPGGDVFEAQAMVSLIKAAGAKKVVAHVDGLAASAASWLVTDAADEIHMADGAMFMIHNSWTLAMGDANEMNRTAALLSKIDNQIAAKYAARTGSTPAAMQKLMDETTWMTAQEAKDGKFVDVIAGEAVEASNKARWDISGMPNAPQEYIKQAADDEQVEEETRALTEARTRRLQLYQIGSANGA